MIFHYDMYKAPLSLHPQKVMKELSKRLGFKIVRSEPRPIGDCWLFEIDTDVKPEDLPEFITINTHPGFA